MNVGSIVLLIAVYIIDRIFHRKFPRLYKKLQLPVNIVGTVLAAVYCGFLIYAVYDVLTSGVSNADKVFFIIFIGIIVSIYAAMVVIEWRRWAKDRSGVKWKSDI